MNSILIIVFLWWSCYSRAPSKYSLSSGFHEWDIGLSDIDGHIAAFGDFNNDKKTDVFVIGHDMRTLLVYLWNSDQYKFKEECSLETTFEILNVVPSDFDHDGSLDILLSGKSDASDNFYDNHIYLGHRTSIDSASVASFSSSDQVLLFDFDGDLRVDLIGSDKNGTRTVWINSGDSGTLSYRSEKVQQQQKSSFAVPNSNAFADVDGDCRADLVVVSSNEDKSKNIEIWTSTGNENDPWMLSSPFFQSDKSFNLPEKASQITWVDVDGDGNADMIYSYDHTIYILYNVQKTMCGTSQSKRKCRQASELCSVDSSFSFIPSETLGSFVKFDMGDLFISTGSEIGLDEIGIISPAAIRTGDVDLDGYPDLVISVGDSSGTFFSTILHNIPCSNSICSKASVQEKRRTFKRFSGASLEKIEGIENSFVGTFIDLNEKGVNDLIIMSFDSASGKRTIHTFVNLLNEDAYFFKTMGLNGVCPEWCSGISFPNPKPYGTNQPGVASRFTVTDIDGNPLVRQVLQLQSSQYLSLLTPYNLLGLGRTNNYIEEYFIGFPIASDHDSKWYRSWQSMIPNSQVIVFPYKRLKPSMWLLELLISPSDSVKWVVISLVCIVAFLSFVIVYLHWKERQQDEAEKKKFDTHFYAF